MASASVSWPLWREMVVNDHGRSAPPILVVAFNGTVYGLDPTSGRETWRCELEGVVPGVAFDADRVYATGYQTLVALDYLSGRELWRVKTAFSSSKSIAIAQGGLVFVAWSGEVECYSRDGQRLWANPFKGDGHGETAIGFPGNFVQAFYDAR
jgi:outer membrane protein assembly factor BamB